MNEIIKMCRLCMDSETPSVTSMEDENFRSKLSAVSIIKFQDNNQLPTGVCPECVQKIDQFYTFMETVRCNQDQLSLSLSPVQIKQEVILEPQFELLEYEVKMEPTSPERVISEELDLPVVENSDCENNSTSPTPADNKQEKLNDKDHLIKEFFALKCDTCSESFETFNLLKRHTKKMHNKPAVLQCCNELFSMKHKILFHINKHLKPCKCDACGKCFPSSQTLKVHQTAKHINKDKKIFQCDKCDKTFPSESLLRTHYRRHDRINCDICKKSLSNVYTLKKHIIVVHKSERNFICDVCGEDFKTFEAMNTHKEVHKQLRIEDGAQCEICNKWLTRKRYLQRHMREKHLSTEITCDICHKVYPNLKCLTAHKGRVHVDEKFECEICGKRFKRNIHLKEHLASHTGVKLYSCEFCGIEMNSNANLSSHKKNKHPEEWMQKKQNAFKFIAKDEQNKII